MSPLFGCPVWGGLLCRCVPHCNHYQRRRKELFMKIYDEHREFANIVIVPREFQPVSNTKELLTIHSGEIEETLQNAGLSYIPPPDAAYALLSRAGRTPGILYCCADTPPYSVRLVHTERGFVWATAGRVDRKGTGHAVFRALSKESAGHGSRERRTCWTGGSIGGKIPENHTMTWAAAAVQSAGESVNHRRRTAFFVCCAVCH